MAASGSLPRDLGSSRRLVGGYLTLVAMDVAGGALAVAGGVNDGLDAWGPDARLAAPWQMIAAQGVLTALAVSPRRRVAVGGSAGLAAACLVSAVSGFFDGAFAADELSRGQVAFQVGLVTGTALVGALAGARAAGLLRAAP
ncbi:hypothetical protein [Georgenia sp. AZ-5]|uniref:hypothetical protein n=1 Tax=Georgenia sp. AZ-5 TaxID=3367526 RepID=UPI003754D36B